ncbi:hypothetical protein DPMN_040683 [Dreissena polymorpha]|uniref:Uncharacterized protein n=1 Tax=Dreissena polymorpha TaxID=45954 RepID=A0A9D4HVF5_DREPO|nr:hypothetical protein DPMN_040683 [Dreissena polymorpha]
MMEEGPSVILRLPKIRQAIIGHPEPLLWFSKRRMILEMIDLEWRLRIGQCRDENGVCDYSDIILQKLKRRRASILKIVGIRMFMEGSAPKDILRRMLS